MRRYRCDLDIQLNSKVEIHDELFKHIVVVCRNQIGSRFELLKNDFAYLAEISEVNKKSAALNILSKRKIPNLPAPYIHLVLANPKTNVLENIVEKSVELGVKSIFLLATEHSFFKSVDKIRLKERRLEKIVSQAMQQSNRHEKLELPDPQSFSSFLEFYKEKPERKGFILYEKTGVSAKNAGPFKSDLTDVGDIYLIVGPEGGFTRSEADMAVSAGFDLLSLGHQILRVETACVASLSILKFKLQIW